MAEERRRVLVLGIDGMDSRITKRLLKENKLPSLQKYIDLGAAREELYML